MCCWKSTASGFASNTLQSMGKLDILCIIRFLSSFAACVCIKVDRVREHTSLSSPHPSFASLSHCKIGKMHVSLKPVVGAPYGAVFEVQGEGKDHVLARVNPIPVWDGITSTDRTNASIVDDGGAQQLTMEEIEKMKSDGVAGEDSRGDVCSLGCLLWSWRMSWSLYLLVLTREA